MKTLITLLLLTLSTTSYAQQITSLPVSCMDISLYEDIINQGGEVIEVVGSGSNVKGDTIHTVFTGNREFGTWTMSIINIELNSVCVVNYGNFYSITEDLPRIVEE